MEYKTLYKLPTDDLYNKFSHITKQVGDNIPIGRIAGHQPDHILLANTVYLAGNGDYLEIGSLYGGSAIITGWVKKEFNLKGNIFCIDPLDGYYGKGRKDTVTGLEVNEQSFWKNMKHFDLVERVSLIKKLSFPFPEEAKRPYNCVFIDGSHKHLDALLDFESVEKFVTNYIIFDNYDSEHAGVRESIRRIIANYSRWEVVHISGITAIFSPKKSNIDVSL